MNCGLSNLTVLKGYLLPDTLAVDTKFDAVLQGIGLGVAGLFESVCNRKLGFLADAEAIVSGNREHFTVPRYPIVSVSLVQVRWAADEAWETQSGEPMLVNEGSGLVKFSGTMGSELSQVKVTWSGGYWFETLEPDEEGYPSAKPEGAADLPSDLQAAYLMQCAAVFGTKDKAGDTIFGGAEGQNLRQGAAALDLAPAVKAILNGYRRYQLS